MHCLLLNFAKAFDSVPHERLLLKMNLLGMYRNLLSWMRYFLTRRQQRVVINGVYSNWATVISGMPQGSVLGPLLFLLYVNDLDTVIKHSTIKLFADDVLLLYAPANNVLDCAVLKEDLAAVTSWSDCWQLNLNPAKCEALTITNKQHPVNYTYYIYQKAIDWRNLVRYLGVYIDSKLNWSSHCQIVSSKATKALNCLRLSMFGRSSEAKCKAYKATYSATYS